jgi:hypothetical protein
MSEVKITDGLINVDELFEKPEKLQDMLTKIYLNEEKSLSENIKDAVFMMDTQFDREISENEKEMILEMMKVSTKKWIEKLELKIKKENSYE